MITYFSLAAGFLTGKYRSDADFAKSARGPGHVEVPEPARSAHSRGARRVAARHACNAGAVALAWLIDRPGVTAPIASATSLAQLGELIAATRLRLDADAVRALDQASA